MWLVDDVREIAHAEEMLTGATPVTTFRDMVFKKKTTELCVYYGLYKDEHLVAYFWSFKVRSLPNTIKAYEFHVIELLRRQGIGLFIYKYIILVDRYTLIPDYSHTTSSSKLWKKLKLIPEIKVGVYNAITDEISYTREEEVYHNDHLHFIATARITIQDIDVDKPEEVTNEVIIETAKRFGVRRLIVTEDFVQGLTTPLSLEV